MSPLLKKILIIGAPIFLRQLFRGKNIYKKLGLTLSVLIAGVWLYSNYISPALKDIVIATPVADQSVLSDIAGLYESQISGVMVTTIGEVTRILANDEKGSRHQRFIIATHDGVSVLIAHNIDLAPSVPVRIGDEVSLYGQYEWNHKGGVLHWTHHDPNKTHEEGWIEHQGRRYE
ncbi:MAG: DUF3465 domain-containing protein [Pseudomonadota bacterium]